MTPTVFLYVVVVTALLAGAAAAAEWGAQGRTPARHFWSVAIILALCVPPVAMAVHTYQARRASVPPAVEMFSVNVATGGERKTAQVRWSPARETLASSFMHRARGIGQRLVPSASPRAVATIVVGWVIASLALIAWIIAGVLHWRRECRAWEPATVDGVAVELSPSTGPAVLGVLSQKIVLPSWATEMAPEYRTLMLAHECEHIRARDPQRLALALGALVLMPWNLALWWCAARLRRAIELDCDARVLRAHPRTKAYGYLLLEVAARGRDTGTLAMPLVGLLRLPSELETRLRAMTRPRTIARRTMFVAGVLVLGAAGTAFGAPVPSLKFLSASPGNAPPPIPAWNPGALKSLELPSAPTTSTADRIPSALPLARDTVPNRSGDSIAKLNRKLDSMTARLRQLEERRKLMQSDIVELDSAHTANMRGKKFMITIENEKDSASDRMTVRGPLRIPEPEEARRFSARIDSAMARAYPDLVTHPDPNAIVWFVSDSSGHHPRTKRTDGGHTDRPFLTMQVSKVFPDISPEEISTVEIRKGSSARGAGAVIWLTLKR